MAVYILVGGRWCDRERSYLTHFMPPCAPLRAHCPPFAPISQPPPPSPLQPFLVFLLFSQHVLLSSALNSSHLNHSSSSSCSLSHPSGTGLLSALQEPLLAHGKHHCCHLRLGGVGRVMGVGRDGEDEWWRTGDTAVIVREEKTCRRVKYRLPESRTLNYSEEWGSW